MKTLLGWLSDPMVHLLLVAVVVIQIAANWNSADNQSRSRGTPVMCSFCKHRHNTEDGCEEELTISQPSSSAQTAQR